MRRYKSPGLLKVSILTLLPSVAGLLALWIYPTESAEVLDLIWEGVTAVLSLLFGLS